MQESPFLLPVTFGCWPVPTLVIASLPSLPRHPWPWSSRQSRLPYSLVPQCSYSRSLSLPLPHPHLTGSQQCHKEPVLHRICCAAYDTARRNPGFPSAPMHVCIIIDSCLPKAGRSGLMTLAVSQAEHLGNSVPSVSPDLPVNR